MSDILSDLRSQSEKIRLYCVQILGTEPSDLIGGKTTYERTADEIERLQRQLENSVSHETLLATEAERDEAREAARYFYELFCIDSSEPVPPAKYCVVEERWPWLEDE